MIDRALLALALIVFGVTAFYLWQKMPMLFVKWRYKNKPWLQSFGIWEDVPVLVYFYTAQCMKCHHQQKPIIEKVQSKFKGGQPSFNVKTIDASQYHELAKSMGVMTVPTTIWLDNKGDIFAYNSGIAPAEKLIRQIKNLTVHG